jgi:hypothetical protein
MIHSTEARPKEIARASILALEHAQGFEPVRSAAWLNWNEWDSDSVFTLDGDRVRLVLIAAIQPGHGAFTRLIAAIEAAGLTPVLVEPSRLLIDWCNRHDWRSRRVGKGRHKQHVWHPRARRFA